MSEDQEKDLENQKGKVAKDKKFMATLERCQAEYFSIKSNILERSDRREIAHSAIYNGVSAHRVMEVIEELNESAGELERAIDRMNNSSGWHAKALIGATIVLAAVTGALVWATLNLAR